jgi:hypothetical protein
MRMQEPEFWQTWESERDRGLVSTLRARLYDVIDA